MMNYTTHHRPTWPRPIPADEKQLVGELTQGIERASRQRNGFVLQASDIECTLLNDGKVFLRHKHFVKLAPDTEHENKLVREISPEGNALLHTLQRIQRQGMDKDGKAVRSGDFFYKRDEGAVLVNLHALLYALDATINPPQQSR